MFVVVIGFVVSGITVNASSDKVVYKSLVTALQVKIQVIYFSYVYVIVSSVVVLYSFIFGRLFPMAILFNARVCFTDGNAKYTVKHLTPQNPCISITLL